MLGVHVQSTIQQIMLHCVSAVKYKLQCKVGYFDLYGFDFMIDEDMKVHSVTCIQFKASTGNQICGIQDCFL